MSSGHVRAQTGPMPRGQLTARHGRPEVVLGWLGTGAAITAVYAVVAVVGALVITDSEWTMLPAIVATVIVAAVIGPVQKWCEQRVSGLVHGERTAPYDAMRRFASQLGAGRDPVELPHRMARLLAEGTGASWAQVWVLVNDRPQLLATHPADAAIDLEPPSVGVPGSRDGMRWVAVGHEGATLGVLRVQERPGHPLTPVEERLFAGLAAQAGVALHAARLRAELVQRHDQLSRQTLELRQARDRLVTTQDRERRRLERDIHDGAQQQLVALGINLRLAQNLAGRSSSRALDLLVEQCTAAVAAVETVTSLSRGALPRGLLERGLVPAFREAADASPIDVVVRGDERWRLALETEAALYFCGLEALQNAVKHSGASRVEMSLEVREAAISLSVVDNGSGLRDGSGSGLINLHQRLDEVGGTLHLQSRPGHGTAVTALVPLRAGVHT